MKLKFVSTVILIDIMLIIFITYMLVKYNQTDGGFKFPPGQNVYLYGVILNDAGVNGEVVGCGDSLVPVKNYESEQFKIVNEGLIAEAVNELISLSNETLGSKFEEGSFYTSAYQPNLSLEKIEINGNVANVFLTGGLSFGGVCDTPRFEKQLERTITQFEGIEFARFYMNGSEENFRKALSGQ